MTTLKGTLTKNADGGYSGVLEHQNMTHQRPKTDGVALVTPELGRVFDEAGKPIGITDLTNAVDSRSAAVKAAEDFAACEIRCHLLHGQLLAELGRLKELSYALDRERADAVIRVQAIAVPTPPTGAAT